MPEASVPAPAAVIADQQQRLWLAGLVAAAVALRVAVRLAGGETAFLTNGYTLHLALAGNLLEGHGLCAAPAESCAVRLPVYSLIVAGFQWLGLLYPGLVILQAAMGSVTVWLTWWLRRRLFDPTMALLAAAATAFNPYAVIHDTALQDTVWVNALMLAALALLIWAAPTSTSIRWLASGTVLALATLTSARILPFVPCAVAWTMVVAGAEWRTRVRNALCVALPVFVLLGGWQVRNLVVVGAPVISTDAGEALYKGNGPRTFSHFPAESIDLTLGEPDSVTPGDQQRIEALAGEELALDRLFREMAVAYIAAHPIETVLGAARKLWVVASAQLSPAAEPLTQWGYRLAFLSVHVLAIAGA